MSAITSLVGDYPDFPIKEAGLGTAYVDKDDRQDGERSVRVVHGGFRDSETRFQFYFPESGRPGRMIQYLEGGHGGHESLIGASEATSWLLDFAFDEVDAYLVESNQGHFPGPDAGFADELQSFGASAESARFSWHLAEILFGARPQYSYVFGVSGGGARTMSCIEYRPDVWDGAAPHLAPSGGHRGSFWAAAYFWLTCRHRIQEISDALAPGGSGDPFSLLTIEEGEGLECALRHGLPGGAVNQVWPIRPWLWGLATDAQRDPYYHDFWYKRGYVGHDAPERLAAHVERYDARITSVLGADETNTTMGTRFATAGAVSAERTAVTLDRVPADTTRLYGAIVTIKSGAAAGRMLPITEVDGEFLSVSPESDREMWSGVRPGDEVSVDNSAFLALCHRWMHMLDLPDSGRFPDEWRGLSKWVVAGEPMYPQIPAPAVENGEPPGGQSGAFDGKVIHVNCVYDGLIWANAALAWRRKVERSLGNGIDAQYRMWWGEHMSHVEPSLLTLITPEKDGGTWDARLCRYDGLTEEALRSLIKWVEHGEAPLASTAFELSDEGEVFLPGAADRRGGPQPVVTVTADGEDRATVRVGEPVRLSGRAIQPPGAGSIIWTSWDFEGRGDRSAQTVPDGEPVQVTAEATHAFDHPGTYFVTFRAAGHSEGARGKGLGVENIARCRVVVTP
ncbi:PKD domain-containing protein [Nocardia nova SH22a]|uniref:PKD domain-containing protein n=1 Tax=Nocardia nova SH22a TaxID=1415166 RepID=W5TKD2_9NOCA|nr:PKD domain-containing protein [Nocardia nova]AHH19825.1 PKD domain-containing protein [Nocardia nova SH22a]